VLVLIFQFLDLVLERLALTFHFFNFTIFDLNLLSGLIKLVLHVGEFFLELLHALLFFLEGIHFLLQGLPVGNVLQQLARVVLVLRLQLLIQLQQVCFLSPFIHAESGERLEVPLQGLHRIVAVLELLPLLLDPLPELVRHRPIFDVWEEVVGLGVRAEELLGGCVKLVHLVHILLELIQPTNLVGSRVLIFLARVAVLQLVPEPTISGGSLRAYH